jgi:NAD(P)-dependent dehydrogenase (short-subunit alcohol dehydrogenase family)
LITGTGGLGFEVARALCLAGAEVIIAGRNPSKGNDAVIRIESAVPRANIRFEYLDLGSLASIDELGHRLRGQRDSLDVLVNNAGIMMPPSRQTTVDGLEAQFATNFLGAFALTARLMPLLRRSSHGTRVVMVSSLAANNGKIDFDDLQSRAKYRPLQAYAQSKLADLMFALEFDRRSTAGGWGISGIAAHPGVAGTALIANGPGHASVFGFMQKALPFLFQSPQQGALPLLYSATSSEATGGCYYGPDGLGGLRGFPAKTRIPAAALDEKTARRLWDEALRLTGSSFLQTERGKS